MAKTGRRRKPSKTRYETKESATAAELKAAIAERRFGSWHAADVLAMAKTSDERDRACQTIVCLVASGQRREVLRDSA